MGTEASTTGYTANTLGALDLAIFFPAWQKRAACIGRGCERWFAASQGSPCYAAREICAACPVIVDCMEAALTNHEEYGIHGGAGEAERRTFGRARQDRPHGPEPVDGCPCAWCKAWSRHRANLDAVKAGTRTIGQRGDRNGKGATHGRRATYARGCRCDPCRWSATKAAQDLAATGTSTAEHWATHVPDGASWAEARAAADEAARSVLAVAS